MTPAAPWPPPGFCFSLAVASPTLSPLVCHQPATTCVYSPTHPPEAVKKRVGSGKASSHLDLLETWDQYKLQSLSEQDSLVDRRVASDGVQALQRPPSLQADWTLPWSRPSKTHRTSQVTAAVRQDPTSCGRQARVLA
ncbi:hypothetical protein KC354_g5136 [Hortaea werneckii]|nr:hypothetical protein KC354_g5136 [Hortaea werneckii]